MSVAAQSPCLGHKRLFDRSDSSPELVASHKRLRRLSASPHGRRELHQTTERPAYALSSSSARAALCGFFPDMDEQVVSDVLNSCGDNFESAIKQLGELRLTASCNPDFGHAQPNGDTSAAPPPRSMPPTLPPTQPQAHGRTLQEWAQTLVSEMTGAQGLEDAQGRATQVLQAFQQALLSAQDKGQDSATQARLEELSRENAILKRAVAIQAQRISEAGNAAQEATGLRNQLTQYESKLHSLELANYSLAMHLRAAAGNANMGLASGRPPDVY